MALWKYFGKCKCTYYICLMTIASCKFILISCECILKLNFCFCAMDHFDWPFTKKSWYFHIPQTLNFSTNMVWLCGWNILNTHLALLYCLIRTFIPNFVHHHFWLKLLQELRYLLGFILINLVVVHPKVFECFDGCILTMGHLVGQKHYEIPPLQVEIIYIYIYIYIYVKAYKCICFTFTPFYMAT